MTAVEQIRSRAGEFTDDPARLGDPIPVTDPSGGIFSWFVPQIDSDRLVGFVELLADLTHRRTSSFRRHRGSLDGCPPARAWLDPGTVAERAAAELGAGEVAAEPYLSFDGAPDRLAWAVPVRGPAGPRIIYVAGDAVWSGGCATGLGP